MSQPSVLAVIVEALKQLREEAQDHGEPPWMAIEFSLGPSHELIIAIRSGKKVARRAVGLRMVCTTNVEQDMLLAYELQRLKEEWSRGWSNQNRRRYG